MRKRVKIWPGFLAAVVLLAGCASSVNIKEMDVETTAGVVDIVVENPDGSKLVLKSDREGMTSDTSSDTNADVSEGSAAANENKLESSAADNTNVSDNAAATESSAAAESTSAATVPETSSAAETTAEEPTADEDGFVPRGTVRCVSDGARIRETPRGTILGNCSYGDILQVDGERTDNGWVHVKSDLYGVGYIYQDFVQ